MNFRKYFKNWLLNHPLLNPYGFTKQRFYGNITSPIRILPDFLIAGFNKSGTNSLFEYMNQHPDERDGPFSSENRPYDEMETRRRKKKKKKNPLLKLKDAKWDPNDKSLTAHFKDFRVDDPPDEEDE